jgi:hypothetical protein
MNTHEQINEMLVDYVLGELSEQQSSEVKTHLAECQDCGGEAERLKALIESTAQMSELSADERTCESAKQALFETIVTEEIKEPTPSPNIGLGFLWRTIMKSRISKLAAAAVIIVAALIGINKFGSSISFTSVAWADVVEKFQSMAFFNATIYIKENASKEPKQVEIWRNSRQKTRIRVDRQVLFAEAGEIVAGYDFNQRRKLSEEEYDENGLMIARKLLDEREFSLNTVLESIRGGKLEEMTPLINPDAMISQDLLVFDIQSKISPEWLRIWALRESRLPTRIRMWDPRNGECIDVFITYSMEQSEEFFDADKYEEVLINSRDYTRGGRTNLAYAFLQDPGGRDYVPKELFEKEGGYHMPVVEQIGITEYGAVWFVVSKSENQRPDGYTFYGFSKVSDDLGRNYSSNAGIHRTDDISVQVFVPEGYPFDKRIPNTITLQCSVENWHPDEPEQIIGSIDIDKWKQNAYWPKDRLKKTEVDIMLVKAWGLARHGKYDETSKIINLVQKINKSVEYSHEIERLELNMLISQKKFDEADKLAEKLWPTEIDIFIDAGPNASLSPFYDYVIAVAANGRIDRAAEMFSELKLVKPDFSEYNKRQQKRFFDRLKKKFDDQIGYRLVRGLFQAGLDLESVNRIAGFNVLGNDTAKWDVPEKYRLAADPGLNAWNQHLEELAKYYKANPLEPRQMELRERGHYEHISNFTPPGLDDYRVWPIGGTLRDYARYCEYPDSLGRVKINVNLEDIELQHELIIRGGTPAEKRRDFVLSQFGLEVVEEEDECTVWIAEYDGRELPDYKSVKPLALRGTQKPGTMTYMASGGINLKSLFLELRKDQDIVIENKTGLREDMIISTVALNFKGDEGAELAKKWYKDNFGITFRKEFRRMPVWVIREKL